MKRATLILTCTLVAPLLTAGVAQASGAWEVEKPPPIWEAKPLVNHLEPVEMGGGFSIENAAGQTTGECGVGGEDIVWNEEPSPNVYEGYDELTKFASKGCGGTGPYPCNPVEEYEIFKTGSNWFSELVGTTDYFVLASVEVKCGSQAPVTYTAITWHPKIGTNVLKSTAASGTFTAPGNHKFKLNGNLSLKALAHQKIRA